MDITAIIAVKHVYLELLQIIETNLGGMKTAKDPEFLHRLRIAVRRTRSVLSLIPGVFTTVELQYFKQEFAWLQQVTSATRDWDVQQIALGNYQTTLEAELKIAVEPIQTFIINYQEKAQDEMLKTLLLPRVSTLLIEWRNALITPPATFHYISGKNRVQNINPPIQYLREIMDSCIKRLHKRILKQGRALTSHSPAESLHDLRKRCKKLRYLLECFPQLYAENMLKHVIKIVKKLVDELGMCQDLTVQSHLICTIHSQWHDEQKVVELTTQQVLKMLLTSIEQRQIATRIQALQTFAVLDSACERDWLRIMLAA